MISTLLLTIWLAGTGTNLVANPGFDQTDASGKKPAGYEIAGDARWAWCGYADETATRGVALKSFNSSGGASGSVSQLVAGLDQRRGKWLRFTFRGRAEDGFSVANDQLAMKLAFYSKGGQDPMDAGERLIYREVQRDRKDFAGNGDDHKSGASVWRTYEFEELMPFREVDAVKLTVGFRGGNAKSEEFSSFFVEDFSLTQGAHSSDGRVEPSAKPVAAGPSSTEGMIALGGRWYYRPAEGESVPVDGNGRLKADLTVTEANSARLYYKDDRPVNPFASNMTAWLRKGDLDVNGQPVKDDRLIPDNVTITFNGSGYMAVHVHNIPNHPTAKFPDMHGTQGYNRAYIQEHRDTYYLPLNPTRNPNAIAMTEGDANGALNMGPVGIAVNGVPFFNPFDAAMTDASNVMDRCCGHPSPDNRYHYHKYPICVNTPFVDKGHGHSPIIGFAADGFPVYGPYESPGVMAKDLTSNKLDAFNAHYDPIRGWHYHVTPGKFPYIIGGYIGSFGKGNPR